MCVMAKKLIFERSKFGLWISRDKERVRDK
jgi:hypothetical protein